MVVKYWDMRQPNPMAQLQATDRVYALDAVNDLMVRSVGQRVDNTDASKQVFGTADRQISIVDLKNPGVIKSVGSSGFGNGIAVYDPLQAKESPLKMQTRVITAFPAGDGYAVGSVEGRVAIQ